ncbi:MAG: GNAT family N-acetyltransferase [Cellulosilyticaceae bacterium]
MLMFEYEVLNASHIPDLVPIWGDPDVIRYTSIKEPCSLDEIRKRIVYLWSFDVFAVRLKGEVIGIIGCPSLDSERNAYGIFYQFKKAVWHKGYGTHCVHWLLKYMQKTHPSATIYGDVLTRNPASERILKRLGFTLHSEEWYGTSSNGLPIAKRRYVRVLKATPRE